MTPGIDKHSNTLFFKDSNSLCFRVVQVNGTNQIFSNSPEIHDEIENFLKNHPKRKDRTLLMCINDVDEAFELAQEFAEQNNYKPYIKKY